MDQSSLFDATHLRGTGISLGIGITLIIALCISAWIGRAWSRAHLPLPPSPKPSPIIGNLLDLPPAGVRAAEWWSRHKELYGEYGYVYNDQPANVLLQGPSAP